MNLILHTPARAAAAAALVHATEQAHVAIDAQLANLEPPTDGPRFLRPLVRVGHTVLVAAAPFLALTAADRLTSLQEAAAQVLDATAPGDAEAQAQIYAHALAVVLAEAAVRLDLPNFLHALPLLRAALRLRARQHLTATPQATLALIRAHTPALLRALPAGEAEAAGHHARALREAMLIEGPNFEPDLQPSAIGTPAWARRL